MLHEYLKKNYTIHYPREIIPLIMKYFVITRCIVELITSDIEPLKRSFDRMMTFHDSSSQYYTKIIPQKGIEIAQFFLNGNYSSMFSTNFFDRFFYTEFESELDIVIDMPTLGFKIEEFNDNDSIILCVRNNTNNRLEIYSGTT